MRRFNNGEFWLIWMAFRLFVDFCCFFEQSIFSRSIDNSYLGAFLILNQISLVYYWIWCDFTLIFRLLQLKWNSKLTIKSNLGDWNQKWPKNLDKKPKKFPEMALPCQTYVQKGIFKISDYLIFRCLEKPCNLYGKLEYFMIILLYRHKLRFSGWLRTSMVVCILTAKPPRFLMILITLVLPKFDYSISKVTKSET